MSMPPQRALLPDHVESIGEIVIRLDGALCYHRWSISPTIELLLHSMPAYICIGRIRQTVFLSQEYTAKVIFASFVCVTLTRNRLPENCYSKGRLVDDMNNERVPFRDLDRRARELPVHDGDQRVVAQVALHYLAHLYIHPLILIHYPFIENIICTRAKCM